jgi:hypothetical protein
LLFERIPALLATASIVLSPDGYIIISSVPATGAAPAIPTSRTTNDRPGNLISFSTAQRVAIVAGSAHPSLLFRVGTFKVGRVMPVVLIRGFTAF